MVIGPVSCIPKELLRRDVIVCFGEDEEEWMAACQAAKLPPPSHRYRGILAGADPRRLSILAPFGSSSVEALLWELLRNKADVERIVLAGTAGAMPAYTGPVGTPVWVGSATPVYQAAAPEGEYAPTMQSFLPTVAALSSDRFYGLSPLVDGPFPAEPELLEAWSRWRDADAIIDMETAAFYATAPRFASSGLKVGAVRVVANPVDDLDALPDASAAALAQAILAGARLLTGSGQPVA